MDKKDKQNNLTKIFANISIHLEPNLLKQEYQDKISHAVNKKQLNKYLSLLSEVNNNYQKVLKYELYFTEFYPNSEKIFDAEALEHHIHAYFEDIDILKNQVTRFIGSLKNDLKIITINKNEIDNALKHFVEQIEKIFKNASEQRNSHHHERRFIDNNLVDSSFYKMILSDANLLRDQIRQEKLDEAKIKEIEFFEKAKKSWILLAQNNNIQISGFINEIFDRIKDFIYKLLNINEIKI